MDESSAVVIDGNTLDLSGFLAVVEGAEVTIHPEAIARVEASRKRVEGTIATGTTIYGINTGFGELSRVRIEPARIRELQMNLLRSHAAGVGPELPEPAVRGMLLLRANALAKGYSGVRREVVETLVAMLNRGVHPVIPGRGSLGASGDLAPLAHLALVLAGEGEAWFRGERLPGAEAMRRAGIPPLRLEAKEGLALINGTQLITSLGALALARGEDLLRIADIAAAATLEVTMGTPVAAHPDIQAVRPHPGQIAVARNIRALTQESGLVAFHRDCDRVQDAYALRCVPQIHGAARDAIEYVRKVITTEFNAATDNPLVFEHGILSGGNFHGQPPALALDTFAIALVTLANVSERRIERLVNPALSGLPPFLAPAPGLHSGYMIAHYTAAALTLENRHAANPASVHSLPVSANKEDHVSNGAHSAHKALEVAKNTEQIVAIELLLACQALDLLRRLHPTADLTPGPGLAAIHSVIRSEIPPLEEDRSPAASITRVGEMIASGSLLSAVEVATGPLA
ncbi:MAG: histidine ammonia-lyase [Deltaproteobacteria bacterium]|nr:MAG: histidine ammonia-lyase [Deltaproteobacteria bacterium]